jgi:hypothetical protein
MGVKAILGTFEKPCFTFHNFTGLSAGYKLYRCNDRQRTTDCRSAKKGCDLWKFFTSLTVKRGELAVVAGNDGVIAGAPGPDETGIELFCPDAILKAALI